MTPRRNALLLFVKSDKNGRYTYNRQIPPELRPFLGGKASIRRTIRSSSADTGSTAFLSAYSVVHMEVEALISETKRQISKTNQLTAPDKQAIPLSPRDVEGISAEPLRQMVDALQTGVISAADPEQLKESVAQFLAQAARAVATGDESELPGALAGLTKPVLDELRISAGEAHQQRINEQFLRYAADARADIEKQQAGDFSLGELSRKAPPKPKRRLTREELHQIWRSHTGETLETDGYGVSSRRDERYTQAIGYLKRGIGDVYPDQLTEEQARSFTRWLRNESGRAIRTQQGTLGCIKNLMKVGRKEGGDCSQPL